MIIQIFGAKGMLGSSVVRHIKNQSLYHVSDERIEEVVPQDIIGDVVINCAGLVKQKHALDSEFIKTNAYGPHVLAEACDRVRSRLIHISTDCVFSDFGPNNEECIPNPEDLYGRSKLAGEVTRKPHLTIRTSFIGRGNTGLVADLQRGPVRASDRLYWSGHTVDTVAWIISVLCKRHDLFGLLHIPGEDQTRYELVEKIIRHLDLPKDRVIRDDTFEADRRLESMRWYDCGLPVLPSFEEELESL